MTISGIGFAWVQWSEKDWDASGFQEQPVKLSQLYHGDNNDDDNDVIIMMMMMLMIMTMMMIMIIMMMLFSGAMLLPDINLSTFRDSK